MRMTPDTDIECAAIGPIPCERLARHAETVP